MSWTTPRTWVASELVTASLMNTHVRDNDNFLYAGVGFIATKSAQSVASGSAVKMAGATEVWDSHSYYDAATNFRFTPLIAGKYQVSVDAAMTTVSGVCYVAVHQNGALTDILQGITLGGADSLNFSASGLVSMNGTTDYLECFVRHSTGSNQNISSRFSAFRVGT